MKKQVLFSIIALASMSLGACGKSNDSTTTKTTDPTVDSGDVVTSDSGSIEPASESTSEIVKKDVTVENVLADLNLLKTGSYKSSYSKEGLTSSKTFIVNDNYVYSSKDSGGHILLSGFTADQDKVTLKFSLSGSTVTILSADVDYGTDGYLSSLDSFIKTRYLSVDADMLSLREDGKRVVLTDAVAISCLKDLIGEDAENPFEITKVEFYYTRYNDLGVVFYEGDAQVDTAEISDFGTATEANIEAYLKDGGSDLLKSGSLTNDNMTYVLSDRIEATSKVQKIVTNTVSDDKTYFLSKSATTIYRKTTDKNGSVLAENSYIVDDDDCVDEYSLNYDNTVYDYYNEDKWFYEYYSLEDLDPVLFRKASGNNYNYYGGKADTILANLLGVDSVSDTFGESVTSLYAVVKDDQVVSLTFTIGASYIITSTFAATPAETIPSITALSDVEGVTDRLTSAFDSLKWSADTYGFKTSMSARGSHSADNTIEGVYYKDLVLNYDRTINSTNDDMKIEGNGYQTVTDGVFTFSLGGVEDDETKATTYSATGSDDIKSGKTVADYWFDVKASANVFYKKAGDDNTFVMYDYVSNKGKGFPALSLYNGESVTGVSVTLTTDNKISKIDFEIEAYDGSTQNISMNFTYGSETNPVVDSSIYDVLTTAYNNAMAPVNDYSQLSQVYKKLHNNNGDSTETLYSDDFIKSIPYYHIAGCKTKWMVYFGYDYTTWSDNYNEFEIDLNWLYVSDSIDETETITAYKALVEKTSGFTKNEDGTYTNSTYNYTLSVSDSYGTFMIKVAKISSAA